MTYLFIIIVLIAFFGCWWSLKKAPRDTAREIKDMLKGKEKQKVILINSKRKTMTIKQNTDPFADIAANLAADIAVATAFSERKKQRDDLLELLKETSLLNIKESATYLGMKDKTLRNVLNHSRYEPLKTKKVMISGKTFFNVEDLLRVKK